VAAVVAVVVLPLVLVVLVVEAQVLQEHLVVREQQILAVVVVEHKP
jgi:hypothetical protein